MYILLLFFHQSCKRLSILLVFFCKINCYLVNVLKVCFNLNITVYTFITLSLLLHSLCCLLPSVSVHEVTDTLTEDALYIMNLFCLTFGIFCSSLDFISFTFRCMWEYVGHTCMWNIKKAECWRIDAFEVWCWRRFLRVPWTMRRSNQSILNIHWKDWCWTLSSDTLATWWEDLTH